MFNLAGLSKRAFFTAKEANEKGISTRMLSYYVKTGKLLRIARGVYCSSEYIALSNALQWQDLAIAATNISGGVICLISALVYYDLTDEFMNEFWIAVNNTKSKVKFPMCRIVRMRNMTLGIKEIELSGMNVHIFDKERTIVDSFRLLDYETAVKALKRYLKGTKERPDIEKLTRYATELRVSKLQEYIQVMLV